MTDFLMNSLRVLKEKNIFQLIEVNLIRVLKISSKYLFLLIKVLYVKLTIYGVQGEYY